MSCEFKRLRKEAEDEMQDAIKERTRGSASMEAVLPALTGRGYEDLAIRDGDTASREYLRVTVGIRAPGERKRIRRQLEVYCGLDTCGMEIISALRKLV